MADATDASQVCGLWTEHRINSRDEGFHDYRDSPPTSSMLCALGPGTIIVETSDPGDPCAHVLRYVGALSEMQVLHNAIEDDGWEPWLVRWKEMQAERTAECEECPRVGECQECGNVY